MKEFVGKYRNLFLVMGMMLKKVLLPLVGLFLIGGCLQRPEPRAGDFTAIVKDVLTKEPIPGVSIDIGGQFRETDRKGRFSLAGLAPGEYLIRMERSWYLSKEISYNHLGKPDLVEFYLQPGEELSGKIFYSLYKSKIDRELYVLDLRTRSCSKLIDLPGTNEYNPCWANSELIAFQKGTDKEGTIHFFYPANKSIKFVCNGIHPSLSKTEMVYKSRDNKITKKKLDSSEEPLTYKDPGYNPVISPDGTKLAYTGGGRNKLIIIDLSTSVVSILQSNGCNIDNPCWSPDGTKIAFEGYQNSEGQRAIYYIEEPFKNLAMNQVTFPSGEKEQHKHPAWGEDGMIYFSGNIVYSSRYDIYGVKVDGGPEWIMVSKGSGNKDYPCWGK